MADIAKAGNEELQLVVFKLGNEEFGVDIQSVQEIIRMANITQIPRAPPYIRGIINLRGRIIVVIGLNAVMERQNTEHNADTRIMVADIDGTVMGFVVDSVSEVIRLPVKDIEAAPAVVKSKLPTEYFRGIGKLNDRLLILLNLEKMLSIEELQHVQSITSETIGNVAE